MKIHKHPKGYRAVFVVGGRWRHTAVVGWVQRDDATLPEAICNADPVCVSKTGLWVFARDVPGFRGVYEPQPYADTGEDYQRHWRRCFPDAPVTWFELESAPFVPSVEVKS